jgi:hypothetical protein
MMPKRKESATWLHNVSSKYLKELQEPITIELRSWASGIKITENLAVLIPYKLFEAMQKEFSQPIEPGQKLNQAARERLRPLTEG